MREKWRTDPGLLTTLASLASVGLSATGEVDLCSSKAVSSGSKAFGGGWGGWWWWWWWMAEETPTPTVAGISSSVGSRSALREITCWIACDLFQEGLRIPVRTRVVFFSHFFNYILFTSSQLIKLILNIESMKHWSGKIK